MKSEEPEKHSAPPAPPPDEKLPRSSKDLGAAVQRDEKMKEKLAKLRASDPFVYPLF